MKRVLKSIALMAIVALPFTAGAQDKVETSIGADVVSNYIWRGQKLGDAAFQPSASVGYAGLSLGAWGSYGFVDKDDVKEIDLTLSYTVGGLTMGVTDYFASTDASDRYFMYEAHRTIHTFEANIGYDFGVCSLNWFTNFAGADGINKSGKRAYSSYCEISAPFKLGSSEWTATIGAVPYATSFYETANGFAVTNVTLQTQKDIKVTEHFTLPLFAAITANPSAQKMYLTAGITF